MQNKANFRKSQMNVNPYNTTDYEEKSDWTPGENKPNSNPIKANSRKAKMNVNSFKTKDYRKNDDFAVRKNKANSNPISSKAKMSANAFSQKDYDNEQRTINNERYSKQTQSNPIYILPQRTLVTAERVVAGLIAQKLFGGNWKFDLEVKWLIWYKQTRQALLFAFSGLMAFCSFFLKEESYGLRHRAIVQAFGRSPMDSFRRIKILTFQFRFLKEGGRVKKN